MIAPDSTSSSGAGDSCKYCRRKFQGKCKRRRDKGLECSSCLKVGGRTRPATFDTAESKAIFAEELRQDQKKLANWVEEVEAYEAGPTTRGNKRKLEQVEHTTACGTDGADTEDDDGGRNHCHSPLPMSEVKRLKKSQLVGSTGKGVHWPSDVYFSHFGEKPNKRSLAQWKGKWGVVIASSYGFKDGCTRLEEVNVDELQQADTLFREGKTGDKASDFFKAGQKRKAVTQKKLGKASKKDDAPVAVKLMTTVSKGPNEIDDQSDTGNILNTLWGDDFLGTIGAPTKEDDDTTPRKRHKPLDQQSKASSSLVSRDLQPYGRSLKEIRTSEEVVSECKAVVHSKETDAILSIVPSVVNAAIAKIEARLKMRDEHLNGFEEGKHLRGVAVLTALEDCKIQMGWLDTIAPHVALLRTPVDGWLDDIGELEALIRQFEEHQVAFAKEPLISMALKAVALHYVTSGLARTRFAQLLDAQPDGDGPPLITMLDAESRAQVKLSIVQNTIEVSLPNKCKAADVHSIASAILEYKGGCLLNAAANQALEHCRIVADPNSVDDIERIREATSALRSSECFLHKAFFSTAGKMMLGSADQHRLYRLRDAEFCKDLVCLQPPPTIDQPVLSLPNPKLWDAFSSGLKKIEAKVTAHCRNTNGQFKKHSMCLDVAKGRLLQGMRDLHKKEITELTSSACGFAGLEVPDACVVVLAGIPTLEASGYMKVATQAGEFDQVRSEFVRDVEVVRDVFKMLVSADPDRDGPLSGGRHLLVKLLPYRQQPTDPSEQGMSHFAKVAIEKILRSSSALLLKHWQMGFTPFVKLLSSKTKWEWEGAHTIECTNLRMNAVFDEYARQYLQYVVPLFDVSDLADEPVITVNGTAISAVAAAFGPRCFSLLRDLESLGGVDESATLMFTKFDNTLRNVTDLYRETYQASLCKTTFDVIGSFLEECRSRSSDLKTAIVAQLKEACTVSLEELAVQLNLEPLCTLTPSFNASPVPLTTVEAAKEFLATCEAKSFVKRCIGTSTHIATYSRVAEMCDIVDGLATVKEKYAEASSVFHSLTACQVLTRQLKEGETIENLKAACYDKLKGTNVPRSIFALLEA